MTMSYCIDKGDGGEGVKGIPRLHHKIDVFVCCDEISSTYIADNIHSVHSVVLFIVCIMLGNICYCMVFC